MCVCVCVCVEAGEVPNRRATWPSVCDDDGTPGVTTYLHNTASFVHTAWFLTCLCVCVCACVQFTHKVRGTQRQSVESEKKQPLENHRTDSLATGVWPPTQGDVYWPAAKQSWDLILSANRAPFCAWTRSAHTDPTTTTTTTATTTKKTSLNEKQRPRPVDFQCRP